MSDNESLGVIRSRRRHSFRFMDFISNDLKAYQDGELSGLRRQLVRGHLRRCQACREEIEGLRRISEEISQSEQATPRPELRARILASLPDTWPANSINLLPGSRRIPSGRLRAPRLALAGVACSALLVAAFALGHLSGRPGVLSAPSAIKPGHKTMLAGGPSRSPVGSSGVSATDPNSSLPTVTSSHDTATSHPSAVTDGNYVYKDPTSREAEAKVEQEMVVEAQQQAREQKQLALAVQRALQQPGSGGDGSQANPLRLALAVPDVTAAGKRLRDLAQSMNGSFQQIRVPDPASDPAASRNSVSRAPLAAKAGEANIVMVRVPAAHASEFRTALKQLAASAAAKPSPTPPAIFMPVPSAPAATVGPLYSPSGSASMLGAVRPQSPVEKLHIMSRPHPQLIDGVDAKPADSVTFLVRLRRKTELRLEK